MNMLNRFYQLLKIRSTQKNTELFLNEKEAVQKLIENFFNDRPLFTDIFIHNLVTEKDIPLLISCIQSFHLYNDKINSNLYENENIQKNLIEIQAYTHPEFIKLIISNSKEVKNFIQFGKGYDSLDSKKLLGNVMDSFLTSGLLYSQEGIKRFNDCITIINKAATQKDKDLYSRKSILLNAFTWNDDDLNNDFYEKIYIAITEISKNNKSIFNKVESVKLSMQNGIEFKQLPNFLSFYDFKDNYNSTLWDNCNSEILMCGLENNFFCHESKENIQKVIFERGILSSLWTQCSYIQLKKFVNYMNDYSNEDFLKSYLQTKTPRKKICQCYYSSSSKKQDIIRKNINIDEEKKKIEFIFNNIYPLSDKSLFYSTLTELLQFYNSISENFSDYFKMEKFIINDIFFNKNDINHKYTDLAPLDLENQEVIFFLKNLMAFKREVHQFDNVLNLIKTSFNFNKEFINDPNSYFWQGNHIWSGVDDTNKENLKKLIYINNEKEHISSIIRTTEDADTKKQKRL